MKQPLLLAAAFLLLGSQAGLAAPVLRGEVTVIGEVVTVGDMFDDAGSLAERALFRAPAPGTIGIVSLDAVRQAALQAGLTDYLADTVTRVRVARSATLVDNAMLGDLIAADLRRQGLIAADVEIDTRFDAGNLSFNAEAVADPVRLVSLRYVPGATTFAARFEIAGRTRPVDVTGTIEQMVEVPHLANSLQSGAVITPADIVMKRIPARFAGASPFHAADDLIGKALLRQARAGLMLKATDIGEPLVVARNSAVTVFLKLGAMTLTVQGQALNAAALGQPVSVMNSVTRKILHGTAIANGAVEIVSLPLTVAGL